MRKSITYNLILSGLLTAVGLILPFITAHAFSLPGNIFLPMHLPVFLIGLLCGPQFGAMGGLVIPILSSLLTGMPAAFPMLPLMIGELMIYGLMSGLLYCKVKLPIYPSLLIAMFCGRACYGFIFAILLIANNGALQAASIFTALIKGIPGIIIQLILIPLIVTFKKRNRNRTVNRPSLSLENPIEHGRSILKQENISCVVLQNNKIVYKANGRGVKPLLDLLAAKPALLQGASVTDKIIGKAAAMLLVLGGATNVYGEVMSTSAYEYLKEHGVQTDYGRCIDVISNREGNGICPLEKAVKEIDDPEAAYTILKETLKQLAGA